MLLLIVALLYAVGLLVAFIVAGVQLYDIKTGKIKWTKLKYPEGYSNSITVQPHIIWACVWPVAVVYFGPKLLVEKIVNKIMAPKRVMEVLSK